MKTQLCPECPLRHSIDEAVKRIKQREYIKTLDQPSAHKVCLELRLMMRNNGCNCPYFPESESLEYHVDADFKRRLDRKNELRKRQNLQHFL